MAALGTVPQHNSTGKLAIGKSGILTVSGFGIRIRVQSNHLEIEDGVGLERREMRLPRVGNGLRRLVCISDDGFVSLRALEWLSDVGASFVMLNRNGKVLFVTGPTAPSDARLRRAQCIALTSGLGLHIARELISQKIAGQELVARRELLDDRTADKIAESREGLTKAESLRTIGIIEAHAAGHYWAAYRTLPVNFPRNQQKRIASHWLTFGNRASALTGSPRRACNPANAILNFWYSILEIESRLALCAVGLDPAIGILHVDTPNRDSLACDLMETARAQVDAFLVRWLTTGTLKKEWFVELPDGACRLTSDFCAFLAESAPTFARAVAPVAEWIAQTLWADGRRAPSERPPATPLTQRRRSEGRGNEYTPTIASAPRPTNICAGCGTTTKGGQNCPKCEREVSRQKLVEVAKLGRIIGHSPDSRRKQSVKQTQHRAARRLWESSAKKEQPTEEEYVRDIQPRVGAITIARIASTLGISQPYAAEIRSGRYRPHPMHWLKLAKLAGVLIDSPSRATGS
jgi:CRISPR-associated endonuclease Cas1